ncbi:MAG TPA: cobalamin biosynthesis protein CobD [Lachnospiraceae bacterium]|nr:cobalamin biosynthesis protein CobD [Lachnospiraceae bacterium]
MNHLIAFVSGFILDLLFGDPHFMPHPVKVMGSLIGFLTKKLNNGSGRKAKGFLMMLFLIVFSGGMSFLILFFAYDLNQYFGIVVEAVMTYQCLAIKQLRRESMLVYRELKKNDLTNGRKAVSMIVGRDTDKLNEEGVTKAAVETVAENTSDGIIAPMIFLAIGGPVLGMIYKAVNTMDSMVGYRNEEFGEFGFFPAKTDDVLNYLPARISAVFMISACSTGRDFDAKNAYRIWKRDRRKHASPNSAQTEAVAAGALHVQLAGDASYFGEIHHKEFIGDPDRTPETEDIKRMNDLMYATAFLGEIISVLGIAAVMLLSGAC